MHGTLHYVITLQYMQSPCNYYILNYPITKDLPELYHYISVYIPQYHTSHISSYIIYGTWFIYCTCSIVPYIHI